MDYDEKPKRKRKPRRWLRWLLGTAVLSVLCCGGVIVGLALLAPVISLEPEYVPPEIGVEVSPLDVAFQPADIAPTGGVYENGDALLLDTLTLAADVQGTDAAVEAVLGMSNADADPVDGVFLVPVPSLDGASVVVDDEPATVTRIPASEARTRVLSLAEEHGDTSLLAYANTPLLEVEGVFPLEPGTSRRVSVSYAHALATVNGMVAVDAPLAWPVASTRPVGQVAVTVSGAATEPIRNIYPATLDFAITREAENTFTAQRTLTNAVPPPSVELYYAPTDAEIAVNVLTFREGADEDGYFVLLAEPSPDAAAEQIVSQDVALVLDRSGSMSGVKWSQTQAAAGFVLENLNLGDRFHVTAFSSGTSFFDNLLSPASSAPGAVSWINGLEANGGTNINDALLQTLDVLTNERPAVVLFMTDGQATEGVQYTPEILDNLQAAVNPNTRIYTFGVGNDVDTLLLDSIAREFGGETGYVRENETIDAEIQGLYAKISSPVLTDVTVDFGEAVAGERVPPGQLPDLYAGQQLVLVGRYRQGGDDMTVTINGTGGGEPQTITADGLRFEAERGGAPFVARLWATRRVGEMLNTVRLGADAGEFVDSIVDLSLRYGIITPETQFLLEQADVLTEAGQETANAQMVENALQLQQNQTGAAAVDAADRLNQLSSALRTGYSSPYSAPLSGSYMRPIVQLTPTPFPAVTASGARLVIEGESYVLALDKAAFGQAMSALPETAQLETPEALIVQVGLLVDRFGVETGIETYNAIYGAYLPLLPAEEAASDAGFEIVQPSPPRPPLRVVADKAFIDLDGVYTDTAFTPDSMTPEAIAPYSPAYKSLLADHPDLAPYLSVGPRVVVVWDGAAYAVG